MAQLEFGINGFAAPEALGFTRGGNTLSREIGGNRYDFSSLLGMDELEEAVDLQQNVWQLSDRDVCPPHMLVTAQDTGGHVIGVRDKSGSLVAFVVGFGGYDTAENTPFVLSDMAAVSPNLRDAGIGFSLKLAQALHVSGHGIGEIRWTYDPLRSRNAYLNLAKLGGIATKFYQDKYGDSLSGGQNDDITDRFLLRWFVSKPAVQKRLLFGQNSESNGPAFLPEATQDNMPDQPTVLVRIPYDLDTLGSEEKKRQQLRFRQIADHYITQQGYAAVDYIRIESEQQGAYVFSKQ